jgi:hypothetical protein
MTSEMRVRLTVWVVIASSMAVCYGLTFLLEPGEAAAGEMVPYVLAGIALAAVIASFPLRASFGNQWNGYLLAVCLSESAALMGFIAHLVAGWSLSWVLFVIGFVGMVLHFPREERR